MNLPGHIRLIRLRSGNARVAVWDAENTTIGQPVLVLAAPAEAGATLAEAWAALKALGSRQPPPAACPFIVWPEAAAAAPETLVLGGLRGEKLELAWPATATEAAVLDLASQHLRLLTILHAEGYSGLQPGPDEAWWDPQLRLLTLAGWETVRRGTESQAGDLVAAAVLWVELLTGSPPLAFPPLSIETDWAAWQRVTLGVRRFLARLLTSDDAKMAAAVALAQVEALLAPRKQLADAATQQERERLADVWTRKGGDLLATDPDTAADWLDLAVRAAPEGWAQPRLIFAQERAVKRVERLLEEARSHVALESYLQAGVAFERAIAAAHGRPALEVVAWRGWTVAELGRMLDALSPQGGLGPFAGLLADLAEVLTLTEKAGVKAGHDALVKARLPWQGQALPQPLDWLEADLRLCQLMAVAGARLARDEAQAAELFAQAIEQSSALPDGYRRALLTQTGDPAAGRREALARQARRETREAAVRAAQAALAANDSREAETQWAAAARLCDSDDRRLAEYRREAHRARLRTQAMAAGAADEPARLAPDTLPNALGALVALQRAFPDDVWGEMQSKRWQVALLAQLAADPTGPAGGWLALSWRNADAVRRGLQEAAPCALGVWQQAVAILEEDLRLATPAALADRLRQVQAQREVIGRELLWLQPAGAAEPTENLLRRLAQGAEALRRRLDQQARLREAYEGALTRREPLEGILAQAADAGLEIYDLPGPSVAELRAAVATRPPAEPLMWRSLAAVADAAWRAGDLQAACRAFQTLADDPDASPKERDYACQVIELIAHGLSPRQLGAEEAVSDEPERSVEKLQRFWESASFRPLEWAWYRWITSAERFWDDGNTKQARLLFERVSNHQDTPDEVKALAKDILSRLDQKVSPEQLLIKAEDSAWNAWRRELLASLAQKQAKDASQPIPPATPHVPTKLPDSAAPPSSALEPKKPAAQDPSNAMCPTERATVEGKIKKLPKGGISDPVGVRAKDLIKKCDDGKIGDARKLIADMELQAITDAQKECVAACTVLLTAVSEALLELHKEVVKAALSKSYSSMSEADQRQAETSLGILCGTGLLSGAESNGYRLKWNAHKDMAK